MAYRVAELRIDSFRGFEGEHVVPLDRGLVIIGGPNGSGKSSTLNAIAWGLAGKAIAQKKVGLAEIPERKGWEVVHEGAAGCSVSLLLLDGARRLTVHRASQKNRCEVKGSVAGSDPLAALGLTIDSFLSSVFLPQELLRGPVSLDPKDRGRLFLDLVGLGAFHELDTVLRDCARAAKKGVEAIEGIRRRLDDQIVGQVAMKRSEVEEMGRQAATAVPGVDAASTDAARGLAKRTGESIADLCERHGLAAPALPEDLAAFERAVRDLLVQVESAHPDMARQKDLNLRQLAIARLQAELADVHKDLAHIRAEEGTLAAEGSEDALKVKAQVLQERIERLRNEIALADAQGEVLDRALAYFEKLSPGTGPIACPVCSQGPVDLGHLRGHLKQALERSGIGPLRAEREQAERDLAAVRALGERHARLLAERQRRDAREQELRRRAGEVGGARVDPGEDLGRVLQGLLEAVERDLAELGRRTEERAQDVRKVRGDLECLSIVRRFQDALGAIQRLEAFAERPEYRELQAQECRAQALLGLAEGLQESLEAERNRAFDERFKAVQGDVSRWFGRIIERPDCASLRIDSKGWTILAGPAGREREVTATFNVGDLTGVALAIFLATATRASHDAGFVILDDPTQGLDDGHKARLAEALAEVARERQVIVASADEGFLERLRGAGTVERYVRRLRPRVLDRACEMEAPIEEK